MKPIQSGTISFSATRTTDIKLSSLQPLVFDKVYLNEGGGYNEHTGLFTAPVNGIYYFAVSFLAVRSSTNLMLIKNNHEVGRGYGYKHVDIGSIVSTVQLKRGDIVRVAGKGHDRTRGDS